GPSKPLRLIRRSRNSKPESCKRDDSSAATCLVIRREIERESLRVENRCKIQRRSSNVRVTLGKGFRKSSLLSTKRNISAHSPSPASATLTQSASSLPNTSNKWPTAKR